MAIYIPRYDGYMFDVPDIDFERCDGTRFHFDEVQSASMTNTSNI